jgi:hypothetical protein
MKATKDHMPQNQNGKKSDPDEMVIAQNHILLTPCPQKTISGELQL